MFRKLVAVLFFFTSLSISLYVDAAEDFALTLERKYSGSDCTSGYLAINGGLASMYALERPWQGNSPMISSIPPGKYKGILRYDHSDRWRVELKDVPNRSNIQIHIGNHVGDTQGCILVGKRLANNSLCSLTASKDAYAELKIAFYGTPNPVQTPDKNISFTIVE